MQLTYRAHGKEGEVTGTREARDRFELARQLRREGMTPLSVEPVAGRTLSVSRLLATLNYYLARIGPRDKIDFAGNLGSMLAAGLSLSRGLSVILRQARNARLRAVLESLEGDITRGETLSGALGKFPAVFPPLFIAVVGAGEESGKLPQSLAMVSDQMGKHHALIKKVRGAMMYPGIIIMAMGVVGVLMLIYVVPTLTQTFNELKVELPLSTKFIIAASGFLVDYTLVALVSFIAFVAVAFRLARTARGKRLLDSTILKFPLISPLVKKVNAATTARTLSSLIAAGVDMVESLTITKRVLQNTLYKEAMDDAIARVQKGVPLSDVFRSHEALYPPFIAEMAEVGEETGKLSDMLVRVAQFYEDEVDTATKNLSTIIEPLLMIVIGVGVGFFAISIISPIYNLTESI